jgi:beta-glucosidase
MRTPIALAAALLALASMPAHGADPAYRDPSLPVESRIEDLLGRMTLEEKVSMLGGDESGFNAGAVDRLGIPALRMSDGPVGVRTGKSTALPVSVNLAATFDTNLARRYGAMIAEEVLAKGKNTILGPCVDIARFPLGGRNFEAFGEDPWLSSRLAVAYIQGVQSNGVIATVKHFACNDEEWKRNDYDVQVDERTLREIHLPAFEAAVTEGHVLALMSAYNLVNGQHCSENRHLLVDVLKNDWGFKGIVMSDWVSVYSTVDAANNGLDLEMPNPVFLGKKLLEAVKAGTVSPSVIDDKVRRNLRVRFEAGLFDRTPAPADETAVRTDAHRRLAETVAEESLVLLKNDGILPLDPHALKTVALIGPSARKARTGGGGSSMVEPWETVSPYEGLSAVLGNGVGLTYAEGARIDEVSPDPVPAAYLRTPDGKAEGLFGEYFANPDFKGPPVATRVDTSIDFVFPESGGSPHPLLAHDNYSIRWTGRLIAATTGMERLALTSDDGSRLYLDGKLLIDNWGNHPAITQYAQIKVTKGEEHEVRIDYYQGGGGAAMRFGWNDPTKPSGEPSIEDAVAVARGAQVAVLCVGNTDAHEGEGVDVEGMELPGRQAELVEAVAAANPNTVLVVYGGVSRAIAPLVGKVRAVVAAFYPGQEGGTALARVLTGAANPAGRLPFSYLAQVTDSPAWAGYRDPGLKVPYSEGVFVGYRYYEKHGVKVLYPFGHGLSYTQFRYDDLRVEKASARAVTARVRVTNTGTRDGDEVVQLYVAPAQSRLPRPIKELKAFARVHVAAGQSQEVVLGLDERAFRYFDPSSGWVIDPGTYEIQVGASSADIRVRAPVEL